MLTTWPDPFNRQKKKKNQRWLKHSPPLCPLCGCPHLKIYVFLILNSFCHQDCSLVYFSWPGDLAPQTFPYLTRDPHPRLPPIPPTQLLLLRSRIAVRLLLLACAVCTVLELQCSALSCTLNPYGDDMHPENNALYCSGNSLWQLFIHLHSYKYTFWGHCLANNGCRAYFGQCDGQHGP